MEQSIQQWLQKGGMRACAAKMHSKSVFLEPDIQAGHLSLSLEVSTSVITTDDRLPLSERLGYMCILLGGWEAYRL